MLIQITVIYNCFYRVVKKLDYIIYMYCLFVEIHEFPKSYYVYTYILLLLFQKYVMNIIHESLFSE